MHSRHHIFDLLHTSDPHAHSGCLFGCGREGNKTSGRPSEGALTESQPAALGLGGSHSVGETPLVPPTFLFLFRKTIGRDRTDTQIEYRDTQLRDLGNPPGKPVGDSFLCYIRSRYRGLDYPTFILSIHENLGPC